MPITKKSDNRVQISFHEIPHSDSVEARIQYRIRKLMKFFRRMVSCRVVVEPLIQRHRQGNLFHIRVSLCVPGEEIVVGGAPGRKLANKDIYVAIRDTFDAVERKLQEHLRRLPRIHHSAGLGVQRADEGIVSRICYEGNDGYGFLRTPSGREVYFHQNSVLNNHFSRLKEGTKVIFKEEVGEKGPQASTVKPRF